MIPPQAMEHSFDFKTIEDLWSGYDFYQQRSFEAITPLISPEDQPCISELDSMNEMGFDGVSEVVQSFENPIAEVPSASKFIDLRQPKEKASPISFSSLELLKTYKPHHYPLNKERYPNEGGNESSTEEIMRTAATRFIKSSTQKNCDPFSGLATKEIKDVNLVTFLLDSAEKVHSQKYNEATDLLDRCFKSSSITGSPVQRLVYYFSDALQERIDRENGMFSSRSGVEGRPDPQDVIKVILTDHPIQLITHSTLPFAQMMQFTAIQTIIDNVASAKRIHLIDLSIKHGLQWTILMQALATRTACPIDRLKISAIGPSEDAISKIGDRLVSFAETLDLPFDFKVVILSDIKELSEEMFAVEEGEVVGAYSSLDMNLMIIRPEGLDNLMGVMKKLKPHIMTVIDVEAKHNSPSFINRFAEALFYYSSFFDCLDCFMDRDDCNRLVMEGSFHSQGIRNIVATEGSERVVRHVGIKKWRSFFARFGLSEVELSSWSLYQAKLLVEQFGNRNSCTLGMDGKSLTIGWKGNPLFFVSAWKFREEKIIA